MPRNDRIPSLDGLRAIAIILVLVGHLRSTHSAPWFLQAALDRLWSVTPGNLGVRIFFVISGFLITGLLLTEHERSSSISLRHFYFRRAFRIMPAFYAFLLAMAGAAIAGWVQIPPRDFLRASTYTTDYLEVLFTLGHSWSLAVEEQFYLIWPGLLVLFSLRGAFRMAFAMLAISPVMRILAFLVPNWPIDPMRGFDCVADALAMGCLLAHYRNALWSLPFYRKLLQSRLMSAWPVVVLLVASAGTRLGPLGLSLMLSVLNLSIGIGIDWCTRFPESFAGRVLNARPIAFIGVLSYSIYLWQQPFLEVSRGIPFPLNLLGLSVCAVASYYLIERPFLKLRARLERRPSAIAAAATPS